jgi:hypothetical protein
MDPTEIKRRAYRACHKDGLDEIVTGISLALIAVFFFNHFHGWAIIFGVGIHKPLKDAFRKRYTYPRVGPGGFLEPGQKTTVVIIGLPALILGLLIIPLLTVKSLAPFLPLYVGLLLTGVNLIRAVIYKVCSGYAYSALFFSSGFFGWLLVSAGIESGRATAYQLWILSVILIPIGLIELLKFLHRFPREKAGQGSNIEQ